MLFASLCKNMVTATTQLVKLNPVILHNIRATYTEALNLLFCISFSVLFYLFGDGGWENYTNQVIQTPLHHHRKDLFFVVIIEVTCVPTKFHSYYY